MILINHSKNIILDFDGVLFDSNFIKEEAIRYASDIDLSKENQKKFLKYFTSHNGIPRDYKISKYYPEKKSLILSRYNNKLKSIYKKAKLTIYALKFLKQFANQNIFILSGGEMAEINNLLELNNLSHFFNKIYCSPCSKIEILNQFDPVNTTFIGDSIVDYKAALHANIFFVLMIGYTQWHDWKNEIDIDKVKIISNLGDLCG